MKRLLLALIRGYKKYISVLMPAACRYTPTCSEYAITAIERFGALLGVILSMRRILRCNPFCSGGYDPVP